MGELIAVLLGNLLTMLDLTELAGGRRRRARKAALQRGERVEIPCVLRDEELTAGEERLGRIAIGNGPARWLRRGEPPAAFAPGELTMQAVDQRAITFHARGGRTELRLHPDEAPLVLRALAD
ncbi:hypothetical protein [Amycolatopsis australiensis]|uniref:Uncharacterized protein n=1 Tax=Amycolatopsis australiensis TaxID=546364 RepID=A0A1K1PJD2_9PSEU|nr:hypothetical protein [Amycolatopsis australiensis]SFW47539.1 hypothetical protein SAMN04489730_0675 [Amycolatopsis australiensis]